MRRADGVWVGPINLGDPREGRSQHEVARAVGSPKLERIIRLVTERSQ